MEMLRVATRNQDSVANKMGIVGIDEEASAVPRHALTIYSDPYNQLVYCLIHCLANLFRKKVKYLNATKARRVHKKLLWQQHQVPRNI